MADGSRGGSLRRRLTRLSSALAAALLVGGSTAAGVAANTGREGDPTTRSAVTTAAESAAPGAPFIASVAPRGLGALVTWTPNPAGDQVTSYTASAAADSSPVPTGCSSPAPSSSPASDSAMLVSGLCAALAYTIRLTATNSIGTGPASAPSDPVVALPAQAPSAPLITTVYGRNAALLVSWSAPDDNGGSAIIGYVLKAKGGGRTVTVKPSASATLATVTGLTNGTAYKLTLAAKNVVGTSASGTGAGTPKAAYPPSLPQGFSAVPDGLGSGVMTSWSAPVDNGGDAISGYRLSYQQMVASSSATSCGTGWAPASGSSPTTLPAGSTATSLTVSSLAADEYFCFSITAQSAAGTGPAATLTAPVTPTVQVASNTVVLTSSTMDALGSDEGGTLTWPAPAPSQVASLNVGQVIVGGGAPAAPDGLLRSVQSISQPSSGTFVIGTTQAALSDALVDGSLAQSSNPLAGGGTVTALVPGVRVSGVSPTVSFSTTVTLSVDVSEQLGAAKISAEGSVAIVPIVSVDIGLQQGFLGIPDGADLSASGKVTATGTLTTQLAANASLAATEIRIGEIDGRAEDIQVGPVPVIVVPKVVISLDLSGQVAVGVSATVTVGAAMTWSTSDTGTLRTQNLSTPVKLTVAPVPGVVVNGSASIGIKVQAEVEIYDVTGPEVDATLALVAKVNFNPPSGTPFLSVGPQVQLQAGWCIDILSFKGCLQVTLATLSFPVFTIKNPPPAFMTMNPVDAFVTPGQTLTFSAVRSDGAVYPITWSLGGGVQTDRISSSGAFTPALPGGRSLTVVAKDSTGLVGTTIVTVGAEFDPPQNLQATFDSTTDSVNLTWAAPAHTGGSSLSGYTLLSTPSTATLTLPASTTGATVDVSPAGATYLFQLYAINGAGLVSAAATVSVVVQPAGFPTAGAWDIASSPNTSTQKNYLDGVSCASASFCVAAGYSVNTSGYDQTLIEAWNGSSWSIASSPNTTTTQDNDLTGVSCASASLCVAAGYSYDNPSGYDQTLIEAWNGSSWSIASSPNTPTEENYLDSVSCASASFCVAAGYSVNTSGYDQTLIEAWNGSSWSIASSPNTSSTQGNYLDGVSCPSASSCVAAGGYVNTSDYSQTLIEAWNGSSWSIASSPNTSSTQGNYLDGVSCPSASFCVAAGYTYGAEQTLIEAWNGSSWSIASSPNPSSTQINAFDGVSCASASFCVAAGSSYDTYGAEQTLIEAWNGSSWSIASSPNTSSTQSNQLSGVSCASASFCAAAGWYTSSYYQTLIEQT